jgi:type IV pilus assembly protein PilA
MKARLENMLRNLRQSKQKKDQAGFTLIELMIVVAIIGILAAIAIPQYQAYTGRAQAAEAINLFSGVKTSLGEYFNENSAWPAAGDCTAADDCNAVLGLSAAADIEGTYVGSVKAASATGIVTVTFDAGVHSGDTMTFTPTNNTGTIEWSCASTSIADSQLPSSCR